MSQFFHIVKSGILQSQSSITDWIQAFGALIAIWAAIYSFLKLFRKDKDKNIQIQALIKLAESQSNINGTMILQLKEQEKQTSILKEFLDLFLQSEAKKSESADFQKKLFEIEQRRKRLDIRPMFSFSGGHSSGEDLHWKIRNEGKRGILKSIEVEEKGNTNFSNMSIERMMEPKMEYELVAKRTDGAGGNFIPRFKINIFFEDVEGNKYKQSFECDAREKRVNEPIDVSP